MYRKSQRNFQSAVCRLAPNMLIGIYCKISKDTECLDRSGLFGLTFLHLRSMSVNRFGS
jgi:hypothetical protein